MATTPNPAVDAYDLGVLLGYSASDQGSVGRISLGLGEGRMMCMQEGVKADHYEVVLLTRDGQKFPIGEGMSRRAATNLLTSFQQQLRLGETEDGARVKDVVSSLDEFEKSSLIRHFLFGTEDGKAYDQVASALYRKGLVQEDPLAEGFQPHRVELTLLGMRVLEVIKGVNPSQVRIDAGRALEAHVQEMKRDRATLWTLVEKDIEASAYSVGYEYGLESKPNAKKAELEHLAFCEVERDLLKLAAAHAGSSRRPANWDEIDELAASITHQAALHMLTDGRDMLRQSIRKAVTRGLDDKGDDVG